MTQKCIYHPAPMTKLRTLDSLPLSNQVSTLVPDSSGQERDLPTLVINTPSLVTPGESTQQPGVDNRWKSPLYSSLYSISDATGTSSPRRPKKGWKYAVFPKSAVFHGPTSFSAIFSEHQSILEDDLMDIGEDVRNHPGAWHFGQPLLGRYRPNGPDARTKETLLAVWNIPALDICQTLLASFDVIRGGTMDPTMIKYCTETLYTEFGAQLSYPRSNESLLPLVETLFDNEEYPLPPSPDNGIEWLSTFTGKNIRFEMLGVLFTSFGIAYLSLQDWDPLFSVPENCERDRKQTAWRMKECAEVCLRMCDYSDTVNVLVVSLLINLKRLETGCAGDESKPSNHIVSKFASTC